MNTASPEAGTVFGLQLVAVFQLPPAVLVQIAVPARAAQSAAKSRDTKQGVNRVREGMLIGLRVLKGCIRSICIAGLAIGETEQILNPKKHDHFPLCPQAEAGSHGDA